MNQTTPESLRPTPGAVRAAKYVTAYDSSDNPQWVTRIQHGPYVAYHYVREAADQLTDMLNDRETGVRELLKDRARLDFLDEHGARIEWLESHQINQGLRQRFSGTARSDLDTIIKSHE